MMKLDIRGWGIVRWEHLVLDLNGTLALDGVLLPGVGDRISRLTLMLEVHLLTADTFGTGSGIAAELGIICHRLAKGSGASERALKQAYVEDLGPAGVVAIGNGANDMDMLRVASLGIAVVGPEGAAVAALSAADIAVTSICDALDLLLNPRRLLATLRS